MNEPFALCPFPCAVGAVLPLLPSVGGLEGVFPQNIFWHRAQGAAFLPVGSRLCAVEEEHDDGEGASLSFQVVGRTLLPGVLRPCPLLQAMVEVEHGEQTFHRMTVTRKGCAVACITLSDKGWAGEREDRSGPRLLELVRPVLSLCFEQRFLLPDDPAALRALVLELATGQGYDLILTNGGTGLSPRDLTPEALLPILSRRLPGFEQKMMQDSLLKTPHAALSRAVAGTVGQTLILALPGSMRGAGENLEAVLPALPHALEKLRGDPGDCGG